MSNKFNSFFKRITESRIEVPDNPMYSAAVKVLNRIESELSEKAYIVGGCVRDIIMGKEPKDVDIASSADPEQISQIFKTHDIGKSKDFGIVVVQQDGFSFEVAQFREDGEYTDNRRPDSVKAVKSFEKDAMRRDFTINALGIDKDGEIIDYVGGLDDLKNKIIKAVGDPKKRFKEDALRILRLLRFAAKTGFDVDENTLTSATELLDSLQTLSVERIRDEFFKSAETGESLARFIEKLDELGILERLIPEFHKMKGLKHNPKHHPEGGPYEHTLSALRASKSTNPLTNLAVLFHDLGKTTTLGYKNDQPTYYGHEAAGVPIFNGIAARLKFSNDDKEAINYAIENHMRGHNIDKMNDKKILQLRHNKHWDLLKDVIYSDEASRLHVFEPEKFETKMGKVEDVLKKFENKPVNEFEKQMGTIINGKMIMELLPNVKGEEIGRIKNAVRDWVIEMGMKVTPEQVKEKIKAVGTMKESSFSKKADEYLEYLEENSAAGAMSVFGDVSATATQFSGDHYAPNDARVPKILGKVQRRTFPELTTAKKKTKKKRGKQIKK